jgi:hypothetical protein
VPQPFQISVRVYNEAGEVVQTLYDGSASVLPQALNLDRDAFVGGLDRVSLLLPGVLSNAPLGLGWSGSNANGQPVAAGSYYIKLESTDPFGTTQSYIKPVIVLPGTTVSSLRLVNEAGETVWHQTIGAAVTGLSLSSDTVALEGEGNGTGAAAVKLTLQLADGSTQVVPWYGSNDQGRLVDSGVYQVIVSSTQPGQAASVSTKRLTVIRSADGNLLGSAMLGPNPAKDVDRLTLSYTPVAGLDGATAELYTLAGGRVAVGMDPALSGTLRIELGNLSGGVYLCVVKMGEQRRVMKVAVVR